LKDMEYKLAKAASTKAGQRQEKDVAFYLRRAFKDHEEVFVINDFKFTHNDETAQIDHLIIYRFGFLLIESKSITGNVRVNKQEEWSRSYRGKWQGMPSPIKQAELQQKLLKELLHEHRSELVGKLLGIQQTLDKRCWHHLCAVSSNAIVERENMPNSVSKKLIKSEFLVDALMRVMDLKSEVLRTLSWLDSRPAFSDCELTYIKDFLLSQCKNKTKQLSKNIPLVKSYDAEHQLTKEKSEHERCSSTLVCKNCKEATLLTPMHGRYGYFVKCKVCEINTPLKKPCKSCNSKQTKVNKRKDTYILKCSDCEGEEQLLPICI
jgi:hypothetical protein